MEQNSSSRDSDDPPHVYDYISDTDSVRWRGSTRGGHEYTYCTCEFSDGGSSVAAECNASTPRQSEGYHSDHDHVRQHEVSKPNPRYPDKAVIAAGTKPISGSGVGGLNNNNDGNLVLGFREGVPMGNFRGHVDFPPGVRDNLGFPLDSIGHPSALIGHGGIPVGHRSHSGIPIDHRSHAGISIDDRSHAGVPIENRNHPGIPNRSHAGIPIEDRSHAGVPIENRNHPGIPNRSHAGIPVENRNNTGIPMDNRSHGDLSFHNGIHNGHLTGSTSLGGFPGDARGQNGGELRFENAFPGGRLSTTESQTDASEYPEHPDEAAQRANALALHPQYFADYFGGGTSSV